MLIGEAGVVAGEAAGEWAVVLAHGESVEDHDARAVLVCSNNGGEDANSIHSSMDRNKDHKLQSVV